LARPCKNKKNTPKSTPPSAKNARPKGGRRGPGRPAVHRFGVRCGARGGSPCPPSTGPPPSRQAGRYGAVWRFAGGLAGRSTRSPRQAQRAQSVPAQPSGAHSVPRGPSPARFVPSPSLGASTGPANPSIRLNFGLTGALAGPSRPSAQPNTHTAPPQHPQRLAGPVGEQTEEAHPPRRLCRHCRTCRKRCWGDGARFGVHRRHKRHKRQGANRRHTTHLSLKILSLLLPLWGIGPPVVHVVVGGVCIKGVSDLSDLSDDAGKRGTAFHDTPSQTAVGGVAEPRALK